MPAEIRILRPTFHASPLPLEFLVQVTCGECGQPPRTISLTRPEAAALIQALHEALASATFSVTVKAFTEKEFTEAQDALWKR